MDRKRKKEEPETVGYNIPSELSFALGADRPELVRPVIKDVKQEKIPATKELVVELLRLVMELMQERERLNDDLLDAREWIEEASLAIYDSRSALENVEEPPTEKLK